MLRERFKIKMEQSYWLQGRELEQSGFSRETVRRTKVIRVAAGGGRGG